MNFTVNRTVLLNQLNVLANGLPNKSPMEALYGIKIQAVEGGVLFTASKSDVIIRTTMTDESLNVTEEGEVLVNGKIFGEVIRKLNSEKVSLVTADNSLVIKANKGTFKLILMDVNTYPDYAFDKEDVTPIEIKADILKNMIKSTVFSASTSEKKPILTGVNFTVGNGNLTAVATDSFRLSQCTYAVPGLELNPITVPSKSLNDLVKCIGDYEGPLYLTLKNSRMLVEFDTVEFETRLLEGNYPNTSKLIDTEFPIELKFDRAELVGIVDRISLLLPSDSAKDKEITYSVVKMNITKDGVELSSNSTYLGTAKEMVSTVSGLADDVNLTLGFSGKYFADALNSFNDSTVTIHFTTNIRPFIITGESGNLIQLVLPVRQ